MASVVLGGIGAAIGGAVGGPAGAALGFSIGSTLGGVLFPPKQPSQERGRLDDVKLTGSHYGAMIPIVHGCQRVGGNVIEASDLRQVVSKKKAGGKGARRQTVKSYTYYVDIAVMACEGRIGRIQRIWGEDVRIYDVSVNPAISPSNITTYTGTQTQTVDPTLQAMHPANQTPAYRNRAYFVIDELDLTPWGGRIPAFTIEVCPLPALLLQALADGATMAYTFNEASGNLINRITPGTFDHGVDAIITRQASGVDPEDLLAYRVSGASAGSPNFGHTQGTRTSWNGSQAWTAEAIVRLVSTPVATRYIVYAERSGGSTAADFTVSNTGTMNAGIQVTGQGFNSQNIASAGEATSYAHYVWQWDGTTFRGWRNGVSKFAVAIGPGGTGLLDATPFNMAFGGVTGAGSLNANVDLDFIAIYPTTHLTTAQIANHVSVAGVV